MFVTVLVVAAVAVAGAVADAHPQYYYQGQGQQQQQQPVVGYAGQTQDQYPYGQQQQQQQQQQPQYYQQPQALPYAAALPPPPPYGGQGRALQYDDRSNLVAPPLPPPSQTTSNYPRTPPSLKFRIGVISDQDKAAKDAGGKLWHAFLKEGYLDLAENRADPTLSKIAVGWDDENIHNITSGLAYSGRGMELSTLNAFNGKLYSCDDKTGVVYQLPLDQEDVEDENNANTTDSTLKPIPWAILADGDFEGPNGFKCEWGTIKDDELWIGGHGVHKYNKSGVIVSSKDRFIKKISPTGEVKHLDWSENFDKMANALGVQNPGYVTHEAAGWSDTLQKWIFTPRKINKEKYSDASDAQSGSNVMLIADEQFNEIEVVHIGSPTPTEGFSGFKFVPGTNDQFIIALKTEETDDYVKSFILAFDLKGNLLLNETEFADVKYEAVEFL